MPPWWWRYCSVPSKKVWYQRVSRVVWLLLGRTRVASSGIWRREYGVGEEENLGNLSRSPTRTLIDCFLGRRALVRRSFYLSVCLSVSFAHLSPLSPSSFTSFQPLTSPSTALSSSSSPPPGSRFRLPAVCLCRRLFALGDPSSSVGPLARFAYHKPRLYPVRQSRFECLAYPGGGGPLLLLGSSSSLLWGIPYRTVPINPTTPHLLPNTAGRHPAQPSPVQHFGECVSERVCGGRPGQLNPTATCDCDLLV